MVKRCHLLGQKKGCMAMHGCRAIEILLMLLEADVIGLPTRPVKFLGDIRT